MVPVFYLALIVLGGVILYPLMRLPFNFYDEGIVLTGALRVLSGEQPYRDFWTLYAPGQFYTLAVLFKVFGISATVERVYDIVLRLALSIVIARWLEERYSRVAALLGWLMVTVTLARGGFSGYAVIPTLLLIFMSLLFFGYYLRSWNQKILVLVAALLSFSVMYRHDLGGLACIMMTLSLFYVKYRDQRCRWTHVVIFLMAVMSMCTLFWSRFLVLEEPNQALYQLFVFPATLFSENRALPYPGVLNFYGLQFFVYPAVFFAVVVATCRKVTKRKLTTIEKTEAALLLMLMASFFNQIRVRPDFIHVIPISIAVVPLLFVSAYGVKLKNRLLTDRLVAAILFTLIGAAGLIFANDFIMASKQLFGSVFKEAPERCCMRQGTAEIPDPQLKALKFISDNTSEKDSIYVGVINHDQFIINDVLLYFLAERPIATYFHELHPGVTDTEEGQQKIIEDMERTKPKVLVLANYNRLEPNRSSVDKHVRIANQYILEHYHQVGRQGHLTFWLQVTSVKGALGCNHTLLWDHVFRRRFVV